MEKMNWDAIEKTADALRKALENQKEVRRSLVAVDATPDDGLAARILSAWLDDSEVTDNTAGLPPTSPVLVMMNEQRVRRNAILREAIRLLGQKEVRA